MFWRTKQKKNVRRDRRKKLLRVEPLEKRQMLSVVSVFTNITAAQSAAVPLAGEPAPAVGVGSGDILLEGDSGIDNIKMQETSPGVYTLSDATGTGATLFSLNGAVAQPTVSAVGANVFVWMDFLTAGANSFELDGPALQSGSSPVTGVLGNLNIIVGNAPTYSNPNAVTASNPNGNMPGVVVNAAGIAGGLNIYSGPTSLSAASLFASSSVKISNSIVSFPSQVNMNVADGAPSTNGSTSVAITGSTFTDPAGPPPPALGLLYGPGSNSTSISSSTIGSQFGYELIISNPAGGSNTMLGTSGAVKVNGGMQVINGANDGSANTGTNVKNILSFNSTTVTGGVQITNAGGDNYVSVLGSTLGSNPTPAAVLVLPTEATTIQDTNAATANAPLSGTDSFFSGAITSAGVVTKSAFPHGLYIDNAAPAGTTVAANSITVVDNTNIGETAPPTTAAGAATDYGATTAFAMPPGGSAADNIPAAWPGSLAAPDDDVGAVPPFDTTFYVNDGLFASTVVIRNGSIVNGRVNVNTTGAGANIGVDSSIVSSLDLVSTGVGTVTWLGGVKISNDMTLDHTGAGSTLYLEPGSVGANNFNSYPAAIDTAIDVTGNVIYDSNDMPPVGGDAEFIVTGVFGWPSGLPTPAVSAPSWVTQSYSTLVLQ